MDLGEPRSQFESLATRHELYTLFTDDKLESMVDYYTPRIEELEGNVTTLGSQITTLQEFDLVFYGDLQNLHNEINAVDRDIGAMSDTLAVATFNNQKRPTSTS